MKKKSLFLAAIVACSLTLTSCYTVSYTVGKGPQSGTEQRGKNHFLIAGLAPVSVADANKMIGDAKDYEVKVTHTFVDGLLAAITGGIYTPTTTIIKK